MNISYKDINTRKQALVSTPNPYPPLGINNMYMNINEKYSFNNARIITVNWEALDKNSNIAFSKLMDVFEACTYNDTENNIKTIFNMINEGVLQKVRSGSQAQECMNRKIGKFKIQNRKIHTRIRTANKHIPNTQAAADNYEKTHGKNKKEDVTEEDLNFINFVENMYEEMIETSRRYDQCDRILLNNDKLNSRFNFDKVIRESKFESEEDYTNCIHTLCEYVDTYNIDMKVKYNVCLENIYYSLNRNGKFIEKEQILGDVSDYFILNNNINEEFLDDIKYIITESKVYDMDDFDKVRYLFEEDEDNYIEEYLILESKKSKKDNNKPKKKEKEEKKRYSLNDFKKSEHKTIVGFRDILNKIYNNSPQNIGLEIGNIFTIIRYVFIVGAFGINPILGIVTLVTDFIIKTETGRNELPRYIKKYKAEIKLVEKNIDNSKSEEETKKLKAYKKQLERCVDDMEAKLDSLYTEKENDERHAKEDEEEFGENLNILCSILDNTDVIYENKDLVTGSIINALKSANQQDLINLVEFCCNAPYIVDNNSILETLKDIREESRNSNVKDYLKINNLNECIYKLENSPEVFINVIEDQNVYRSYEFTKSLRECIIDAIDCVPTPEDLLGTVNESKGLSLTSKLKISLDKLRKASVNLSDKEKALSKSIDVSVDALQKNAERALVSNNREAVIKGTILPSASKCIKGALITGAAWALSPALAVIGLLGAIGASKKLQSKERQLIIDDIDIELNMCERYLKMAESKDDLQAQRNILQTQRELQRQKQRLQYNMQVKFREKTPPKLNTPGVEESFNISEENLILERSGINKDKIKKELNTAKDIAKTKVALQLDGSTDTEEFINKSFKSEINLGNKKLKNKKLTKEDMINNPELVREFIKEEGDDPYINLGNAIRILDIMISVVSAASGNIAEYLVIMLCKRIIKDIIGVIKISGNILDPKVKVAIKTTKRDLLKYIQKIDIQLKVEKDPKKRKQLEKERDVLMSCYNDVIKEVSIERKVR